MALDCCPGCQPVCSGDVSVDNVHTALDSLVTVFFGVSLGVDWALDSPSRDLAHYLAVGLFQSRSPLASGAASDQQGAGQQLGGRWRVCVRGAPMPAASMDENERPTQASGCATHQLHPGASDGPSSAKRVGAWLQCVWAVGHACGKAQYARPRWPAPSTPPSTHMPLHHNGIGRLRMLRPITTGEA